MKELHQESLSNCQGEHLLDITMAKRKSPSRLEVEQCIGDGNRVWFWRDLWCRELALSSSFSTLFNLVAHKDAMVRDVQENNGGGVGWSPCFTRSFNN